MSERVMGILYKSGGDIPHIDAKLADDLLLDTAFSQIMPDNSKRQIFLSVLTNPLTDACELAWRAEILHDFSAAPNLLDGMKTELDALVKLRDEAQRERSRAYTTSKSVDSDSALSNTRMITMLWAKTCAKAVHIVGQLAQVMRTYQIHSEGLKALRERCVELSGQEGELSEICRRLEDYGYSGEGSASIRIGFGEDGRLNLCELVDIEQSAELETKPKSKPTVFAKFLPRLEKKPLESKITVSDPFGKLRNLLFSTGLAGTNELLDRFVREIFDELCHIRRELSFYECACEYIGSMKSKAVPLSVPEVSDSTEIHELYDLLLVSTYPNASAVVPNACLIGERVGVLITGENNSGKTVYLRSMGIAQLLFQSGLPIPAKSARMRLRGALVTLWAAAEKEFVSGNEAGRFEQEVRELAPIIDSLPEGSLILLNEIFQTTSYSEGAEGLYHILRYLEGRGVSFIAVTHLRELVYRFGKDALHLVTREGYKIISACL